MLHPLTWFKRAPQRATVLAIRDEAPSAVEALARLFTDARLRDDGTLRGRVRTILVATENHFVPGLHTGLPLGQSGFRPEFEDPWPTSSDQAGHFLTAVRLTCDPAFLRGPLFVLLLGSFGDAQTGLRLMIGHEKAPDPPDAEQAGWRSLLAAIKHFRAQYHTVTAADVENFQRGQLEAIAVGAGLGNSRADLALSYKGWQFGQAVRAGGLATKTAAAAWIRAELAAPPTHASW